MPVQPNRRIQYGKIDRWALSGTDLQRHRLSHQVSIGRLAVAMGVSIYRIEQLERQARTTRATAHAYLAALDDAWLNPKPVDLAVRRAWEEARELERQREREAYYAKHEERDAEREHRQRWRAFETELRADAVAAFIDHCVEATDDVQPDAVGTELEALYERLKAEHRLWPTFAEVVRMLEARGLLVRAGSLEVLMRVPAPTVRGRRPSAPRLDTGRQPAYSVMCRLSSFGRRLAGASQDVDTEPAG